MKKKIFNLSLILILMASVLFLLTGCGDKDSKDDDDEGGSSSAEGTIKAFYEAMNDHDADKMLKYIDLDTLEELPGGDDVGEEEIKEYLNDFFDENEDFEAKVKKVTILKDDEDMMDEMTSSETYDSYEEFIEDGEDELGVKNLDVYTVKVDFSDEFEYYADSDSKKDMAIVHKVDGEYKIIYTVSLQGIISDAIYDYDDDEDYDSDYDYDDNPEVEAFNSEYESYEGDSITGKEVKELIDKVISNNEKDDDFDNPIYITTYDEDGYLDVSMACETEDLGDIKSEIVSTHEYEVEFEEGYTGRVRYIDVRY